jgi:hypothetical protein
MKCRFEAINADGAHALALSNTIATIVSAMQYGRLLAMVVCSSALCALVALLASVFTMSASMQRWRHPHYSGSGSNHHRSKHCLLLAVAAGACSLLLLLVSAPCYLYRAYINY